MTIDKCEDVCMKDVVCEELKPAQTYKKHKAKSIHNSYMCHLLNSQSCLNATKHAKTEMIQ